MQDFGAVANGLEIDSARELLTATLKELAYSLKENSADTENWVKSLRDASKTF